MEEASRKATGQTQCLEHSLRKAFVNQKNAEMKMRPLPLSVMSMGSIIVLQLAKTVEA